MTKKNLTIRQHKFLANLKNFTEADVRDDLSLTYFARQLAKKRFGDKADNAVVKSIIEKGKAKFGNNNFSALKDYIKKVYQKPERE